MDKKERMFRLMENINPDFKRKKLNESANNEYLPISTPLGGSDDKLFTSIVNQGIDSHLEGFTKSRFYTKENSLGKRRVFDFHKSELPILLRRLEEIGTEDAMQWKYNIEDYKDENDESLDETLKKFKVNPRYTHFALSKKNNKILNGWDYNGYDVEDLKSGKKEYFINDIIDMDLNPNDITILTKKALERKGINPFDSNNWSNTVEDESTSINENTNSDSLIKKYVLFSYNYPYDFIEKVWEDEPNLANHLKSKFDSYYKNYGARAVMNEFYVNLDSENQSKLDNWIINNYKG